MLRVVRSTGGSVSAYKPRPLALQRGSHLKTTASPSHPSQPAKSNIHSRDHAKVDPLPIQRVTGNIKYTSESVRVNQ